MPHRPIFYVLNGTREVYGGCNLTPYLRQRIVDANPDPELDGNNFAFTVLESILKKSGYTPTIYENGRVVLTIPINDRYGWILGEISRAYLLAGKLVNRESKK